MNKLTTEQYLLLSKAAYSDFSQVNLDASQGDIEKFTAIQHLSTLNIHGESIDSATDKTSLLYGYKNADGNVNSVVYNSLDQMNGWRLIDYQANSSDGFSASAFGYFDEKGVVKDIVFSYRGTEPHSLAALPYDVHTDVLLHALDRETLVSQKLQAQKLYSRVRARYGYDAVVSHTGHSLGGALAQVMAASYNQKGVTFNALGVAEITGYNSSDYNSLITNYSMAGDAVSGAQERLGREVLIARDIDNVGEYTEEILQTPVNAITEHSLDAFVDDSGKLNENYSSYISEVYQGARLLIMKPFVNATRIGVNTVKYGGSSLFYMTYGMLETGRGAFNAAAEGAKTVWNGFMALGQAYYKGSEYIGYGAGEVLQVAKKTATDSWAYMVQTSTAIKDGIVKSANVAWHTITSSAEYVIATAQLLGKTATDFVGSVSSSLWNEWHEFADGIGSIYRNIFSTLMPRFDPLVFDLNGDGTKTIKLEDSKVQFDLDNNGLAERTSWLDAYDGLLVLDKNNNGRIDNGSELFGDRTYLSNGTYATSGFQALAQHDDNRDGVIDERDAIFSRLKIWSDANQNGQTDFGELIDLNYYEIAAITLGSTIVNIADENDNVIVRSGSYVTASGEERQVNEYLFQQNNRITTESSENIDTPIEIDTYTISNIYGSGEVASLKTIIERRSDGKIEGKIKEFVEAKSSERYDIIRSIIHLWTGSEDVLSTDRGVHIDGRDIAALERLMGEPYVNRNGTNPTRANPIRANATRLKRLFDSFVEKVHASLLLDTVLSEVIGTIMLRRGADDTISVDLSQTMQYIDEKISNDLNTGLDLLREFVFFMNTTPYVDTDGYAAFVDEYTERSSDTAQAVLVSGVTVKYGTSDDDRLQDPLLFGGAGNDDLRGSQNSLAILAGGDGDDILRGDSQNDILIGGKGTDTLYGLKGEDVYRYYIGDGHDFITDLDTTTAKDTIIFGVGIRPENVHVQRDGQYDLKVTFTGRPDDSITIRQYFGSYQARSYGASYRKAYVVEEMRFSDGTVWDEATLREKALYQYGTDGDDRIAGYQTQYNYLYGGAGNDRLILAGSFAGEMYGGDGNDVLEYDYYSYYKTNSLFVGGKGDDMLRGGMSQNTYIYNLGDGHDTIVDYNKNPARGDTEVVIDRLKFGVGITRDMVRFERENNTVTLYIDGPTEITKGSVRMDGYFTDDIRYLGNRESHIEEIIFSDGTILRKDDVDRALSITYGTDGDDKLYAYNKRRGMVYAGAGNDELYANYYQDSELYGESGDDLVVGSSNTSVSDVLVGGVGNDTLRGNGGADIYRYHKGDGNDTIIDYYSGSYGAKPVTTLELKDIDASTVTLKRVYDADNRYSHLQITFTDSQTDSILVKNYFGVFYYGNYLGAHRYQIGKIAFDDGTIWSIGDVWDKTRYVYGTDADDVLYSHSDMDGIVYGGAGNDRLYASGYPHTPADILYGGSGDDELVAGQVATIMDGGEGDDILRGSDRSNVYKYTPGQGNDTIVERGGNDTLELNAPLLSVLLQRTGEQSRDLQVSFAGTEGSVTVEKAFNWRYLYYVMAGQPVETIVTNDGYSLASTQVDTLIQAMASYSTEKGMSWSDAVQYDPQGVKDVVLNYWTT